VAAVIGVFAVIGVRAIATLNDSMLQRASAGFVALSVVLVGVAMIVYRSLLVASSRRAGGCLASERLDGSTRPIECPATSRAFVASRICRRDAAGQAGQTAL